MDAQSKLSLQWGNKLEGPISDVALKYYKVLVSIEMWHYKPYLNALRMCRLNPMHMLHVTEAWLFQILSCAELDELVMHALSMRRSNMVGKIYCC